MQLNASTILSFFRLFHQCHFQLYISYSPETLVNSDADDVFLPNSKIITLGQFLTFLQEKYSSSFTISNWFSFIDLDLTTKPYHICASPETGKFVANFSAKYIRCVVRIHGIEKPTREIHPAVKSLGLPQFVIFLTKRRQVAWTSPYHEGPYKIYDKAVLLHFEDGSDRVTLSYVNIWELLNAQVDQRKLRTWQGIESTYWKTFYANISQVCVNLKHHQQSAFFQDTGHYSNLTFYLNFARYQHYRFYAKPRIFSIITICVNFSLHYERPLPKLPYPCTCSTICENNSSQKGNSLTFPNIPPPQALLPSNCVNLPISYIPISGDLAHPIPRVSIKKVLFSAKRIKDVMAFSTVFFACAVLSFFGNILRKKYQVRILVARLRQTVELWCKKHAKWLSGIGISFKPGNGVKIMLQSLNNLFIPFKKLTICTYVRNVHKYDNIQHC